jgi:hypothetical protein
MSTALIIVLVAAIVITGLIALYRTSRERPSIVQRLTRR